MTEEEFYKQKIFNRIGINQLKSQFPNLKKIISGWYQSDRYNKIQNFKSFLKSKLKQIAEEGEINNLTPDQLYLIFQWWDRTPKVCEYCSLTETALEELRCKPGHINKRYPQRGKSLEIDRKQSNLPYSVIENLSLACYWCNNAKTDTFTEDEFRPIGQAIKLIWENRLKRQL